MSNCRPWMTHAGGETFRNRVMGKAEEAKRRRKMLKMLSTWAGDMGESKKRAHTQTSCASFHLIGTTKMDKRKLRKRREI